MKTYSILILFTLLAITSCTQSREEKYFAQSFELNSMGDTMNLVDGSKLRQGLWLMPISKDTVVYLNDTAHSVTAPMTSGEVIRLLLKDGNKGVVMLPDSFVVKSH